jgi:lipopolysaccharide transport system permease protein
MTTLAIPRTAGGNLGALLWTLARTDFKVRYHGTIGGFLWVLLKPFLMFLVLMSVFSFLFASDPAYKLNLVIGLFLYDFFGESTKAGLSSLYSKGYLLAKARFPIAAVIVASISNAWITLGILAVIVAIVAATTGSAFSVTGLLLFIAYLILLSGVVVGFSLASAVLYLRYRDLIQIWHVIIQAGFFAAPVIYPLKMIPEKYQLYLYLWPPTAFIEFSRMVLVEGRFPTTAAHLCLVLEAAVALMIGNLIFRRYAPRAAEYL